MNTTYGRAKDVQKMRLTLMSFERLSRRKMYVREELILSILSSGREVSSGKEEEKPGEDRRYN